MNFRYYVVGTPQKHKSKHNNNVNDNDNISQSYYIYHNVEQVQRVMSEHPSYRYKACQDMHEAIKLRENGWIEEEEEEEAQNALPPRKRQKCDANKKQITCQQELEQSININKHGLTSVFNGAKYTFILYFTQHAFSWVNPSNAIISGGICTSSLQSLSFLKSLLSIMDYLATIYTTKKYHNRSKHTPICTIYLSSSLKPHVRQLLNTSYLPNNNNNKEWWLHWLKFYMEYSQYEELELEWKYCDVVENQQLIQLFSNVCTRYMSEALQKKDQTPHILSNTNTNTSNNKITVHHVEAHSITTNIANIVISEKDISISFGTRSYKISQNYLPGQLTSTNVIHAVVKVCRWLQLQLTPTTLTSSTCIKAFVSTNQTIGNMILQQQQPFSSSSSVLDRILEEYHDFKEKYQITVITTDMMDCDMKQE